VFVWSVKILHQHLFGIIIACIILPTSQVSKTKHKIGPVFLVILIDGSMLMSSVQYVGIMPVIIMGFIGIGRVIMNRNTIFVTIINKHI